MINKNIKIMKAGKNIYIPEWFWIDERNVIVETKLLTHVIEKQKSIATQQIIAHNHTSQTILNSPMCGWL